VIAWPTGGGSAGITESRKLDVLAAMFRDRLIDQLRSQAGVSYSPNVASQWPLGLASGGKLIALGMVPPDKTDFFFEARPRHRRRSDRQADRRRRAQSRADAAQAADPRRVERQHVLDAAGRGRQL
jgi:hypothetical protein